MGNNNPRLAVIKIEVPTQKDAGPDIGYAYTKAKEQVESKLYDLFPDENVYSWYLVHKSTIYVNYDFGDRSYYLYKFYLYKGTPIP